MARDRREEILVRLVEICDGIDGINKAWRNRSGLSEHEQPFIRVSDGDEGASENVTPGAEHRGGGGHVFTMQPVIGILLGAAPENVGSELNAMRVKVIKAIQTDAGLLSICGRNGRIRYLGLVNAIQVARAAEGEMLLQFSISYPLLPAEL